MKKTYKIKLPKGANIDTVETNENNGVLEVAVALKKKYAPKDGDFISFNDYYGLNIAIYKVKYAIGHKLYCFYNEKKGLYDKGGNVTTFDFTCRSSTEEEKKLLIEKLAKKGKRWNAEKKCIEDLPRWRAVISGLYYIVDTDFFIREMKEKGERTDCALYNAGNYFRTREAAEKVAGQIRDIFKNSKAE